MAFWYTISLSFTLVNSRFLSLPGKLHLRKSCKGVSQSIKSGVSTSHLAFHFMVHQAHISIPSLKRFLKPTTFNIIYIKGILSSVFRLTFSSKRNIPSHSENRPQTGPDHFFYAIQRHKIEKSIRTKVGRKMKLASRTVNRGRPKKVSPVKPTSEELIETFKGLKLKQRIGKFSRNGRRIVA
jgi:hypothetical protein